MLAFSTLNQISYALIMVLSLIYLSYFLARKYLPAAKKFGSIDILGNVHLSNKEKIILLAVNKQIILAGVTAHNINFMSVGNSSATFSQIMQESNVENEN